MPKQSVVIDLPEEIYIKYKQQAEQTQRTVEVEIAEVVAKAVPAKDKLDGEIEELVAQLTFLNYKALRRIANSSFAKKDAAKIEALHFKRQNEGLDDTESTLLANLMNKFERWFVLRQEALGVLIERGYTAAEITPEK